MTGNPGPARLHELTMSWCVCSVRYASTLTFTQVRFLNHLRPFLPILPEADSSFPDRKVCNSLATSFSTDEAPLPHPLLPVFAGAVVRCHVVRLDRPALLDVYSLTATFGWCESSSTSTLASGKTPRTQHFARPGIGLTASPASSALPVIVVLLDASSRRATDSCLVLRYCRTLRPTSLPPPVIFGVALQVASISVKSNRLWGQRGSYPIKLYTSNMSVMLASGLILPDARLALPK
ncbi:hypothetical protein C8F01DRAFT_1248302 [Mycena amicta]|nr:hypothetical protein C8F01DRAFT_1248302 [Mycena amicta]